MKLFEFDVPKRTNNDEVAEADPKMPATRDRAVSANKGTWYDDDTKKWPKGKRIAARSGRYLKGKHGLGQKNPNAADYYDDTNEGIADTQAQVSSVPRTKDNKLNPKGRIKVKPPRGKAYYFKTVDDAEIFFGKDMAEIEANATVTYPKVKEVTESDNNDEQVLQAIKAQFKLDWPSSIRRWIKTARAYGIPLTVEEYAAYRKDSGQVEEAIVPYDGDDQDEYPFWDDETGEVFPAGMNSEVSFDNDEEDDDDDDDDWDTPEPKRRSFDSAQQALAYSTFGDIAAGGGDPIDYLMTNMGLDMGLIDSMAIDQGYEDANEWAQSYQEMESVLNNAGLKKHK